jgi:hypothetical protein
MMVDGKKSQSLCIDEMQSLVDLAGKALDVGALLPCMCLACAWVDEFDLRQLLLQCLRGCLRL